MPGTGQVTATRDTGTTINSTTMLLEAEVTASAPGIAPFPAKVTVPHGRTQWGAIQPEMVVPVLISRRDPSRVVFDPSRPVQMARRWVACPAPPASRPRCVRPPT